MLTSKDADFFQRSTVYGAPPKVLWLRVGNAPTSAIADLLRHRYLLVRRFHDDPSTALLPLALS